MAENQNTLSNELLDQLQKIPHLLRRAHHGAKHRMFQDEARQDEHWHAHHHGRPDGRSFGARGQGKLLRMLLEHDGILMKDIVEELDIRPSSASELVAKLEKRGFIRTETDAQDKRGKRVYTTEKTLQYADKLKTTHSEMTAEVFATLTDEEQAQLLTLLRKVTDSLSNRESGTDNLL